MLSMYNADSRQWRIYLFDVDKRTIDFPGRRPIHRPARRVLQVAGVEGQDHPRSVRLARSVADVRPNGAIVLRPRRQDVGGELDLRAHEVGTGAPVRRGVSTLTVGDERGSSSVLTNHRDERRESRTGNRVPDQTAIGFPTRGSGCANGVQIVSKIEGHHVNSSGFAWTDCRSQLWDLSEESSNDARLPDTRPRAHNPKVAGSNPAPATRKPQALSVLTERVFESSGSSFETLTVF